MEPVRNDIWDADKSLFENMEGNYVSDAEAVFFRNMKYKQEYEPSLANDVIVSENDNPDELYLVRVEYDEYLIGKGKDETSEIHLMNLSEALSTNLKLIGVGNGDTTLLEWLRSNDYSYVRYNRNYDMC